jgi:hypothetical protein
VAGVPAPAPAGDPVAGRPAAPDAVAGGVPGGDGTARVTPAPPGEGVAERAAAVQVGPGATAARGADGPEAARPRTERPAAPAARFAVEFGPFPTATEAESVERALSQAGHQTVRFRQQAGTAVYAVLVERIPTLRDAQAIAAGLRDQGLGDGAVVGTSEPYTVRVGEPLPLRGAVQLAERVRAAGHRVRVAAQAGEAVTYVIRHGNFASREEAEAKGRELVRLGLPNQAVQVK